MFIEDPNSIKNNPEIPDDLARKLIESGKDEINELIGEVKDSRKLFLVSQKMSQIIEGLPKSDIIEKRKLGEIRAKLNTERSRLLRIEGVKRSIEKPYEVSKEKINV